MSIRIVTDSSCDLPDDLVQRWNIEIVPLTIRFGEEEFLDRVELPAKQFWAKCATSPMLPTTAAPSPEQFTTAYGQLGAAGADGIVVITLSSEISATFQSAELAARDFDDIPVRVVDSRSTTLGLGMIVLAAARATEGGAALEQIDETARDLSSRTRVFGAIDTLDNLKKSGRVSNAKAMFATALSIKPLIEVRDGEVQQAGRQRTRSKALTHVIARLAEYQGRIENLAVLHADCDDVDSFVKRVEPYADGDVVVGEIGPVVGSHAGRGTIGVAFHEANA
ncbi:MAG: DegV family protein [Actinomycetota bacterium]|nr:DegV family protein [Actinomycetota bacterium]